MMTLVRFVAIASLLLGASAAPAAQGDGRIANVK